MANLILEISDQMARSLESLAAERHKSVEQLGVEQLSSLVEPKMVGTAAAVLEAMRRAPHVTSEDTDELDRAIAAGRLPVRNPNLFDD
jgi:hypothetical protein